MRLNPDCIRDILLTVEEKCDFDMPWEYNKDDIDSDYLCNYSHNEIVYHIRQAEESRLITGLHYYDGGSSVLISDLSPKGHEFLSNIRSDTVWNDVKEVSTKVGSRSLTAITQIASGVITQIIKHQLGI